jgi:hypothetical protein
MGISTKIYQYDTQTHEWTRGIDMPTARPGVLAWQYHDTIAIGVYIYTYVFLKKKKKFALLVCYGSPLCNIS